MAVERRKHRRFPIIKDLAEPIEISLLDENQNVIHIPGILTNLSSGGMDMVLMGSIEGKPRINLSFHLPGFDRFELEGRVVWTRPKGPTEVLGLEFTKIDKDHAHQITHMAQAYWECEERIATQADTVCFHGCTYWDLCHKTEKLKEPSAKTNGIAKNGHKKINGKKTKKKISKR